MGFRGKTYTYFFISVIVILSIFFFILKSNGKKDLYSRTEFLMDTIVSVKVNRNPGAEEAVNKAFKEMKLWGDKLNRFNKDSIVSKINDSNGKGIKVEVEIISMLEKGKVYSSLSQGAFDITMAPLMDLWGFGSGNEHVPDKKEIALALKNIDYNKLCLDTDNNIVYLPEGMGLDFGGIAKGFIVDKGIEVLEKLGIKSAYINAGGNIRVIGNKNEGRPWHIGIRKPREPEDIFEDYILSINTGSISTSGDYERYFIENGIRYSHILDPRTGYSSRGIYSVSIYAPEAIDADILSTAVFVLGWDKGKRFIESLPDIEGFMVREKEIWTSKGFNKFLFK